MDESSRERMITLFERGLKVPRAQRAEFHHNAHPSGTHALRAMDYFAVTGSFWCRSNPLPSSPRSRTGE